MVGTQALDHAILPFSGDPQPIVYRDQSRIPVILMLPCLDLYLRFKEMITPVRPSMT